jgi:tRNA A37 methylthiotransferase MiaB
MSSRKKFHIITTTEGCITNLLENASYRENLKHQGMSNCQNPDEADVIIVNTCGYTTERENYTTTVIKNLKDKFPQKEIIIGGCLPKINNDKLRTVYNGPVFNPGDINGLNNILKIEASNDEISGANFFDVQDFDDLSGDHKLALWMRPHYFKFEKLVSRSFQPLHNILKTVIVNNEFYSIVVSQGCMGKCTFCAIKSAKGSVKSRHLDVILSDFKRGLKAGHRKFWLVGDDIGCYGQDLGTDFSVLLKRILELPDEFELVINYFEPMFFIKLFDKMEHLLKDKRILNINFPLQSGSFKIVRRMGREYDPVIVMDRIRKIKKANPDLVVKTNIIVGFPGESLKDYLASMKTIFEFDAILAIKYTPRPGTGAMMYKDHISAPVQDLRIRVMKAVTFLRHCYVALKALSKGGLELEDKRIL